MSDEPTAQRDAEIAALGERTAALVARRGVVAMIALAPFVVPALVSIVVSRDALAQGQSSQHHTMMN